MSTEQNKALVRQLVEAAINQGNISNSKFGERNEVACKIPGLGLRFHGNPNKPEVE
jgi:hypothetical protein